MKLDLDAIRAQFAHALPGDTLSYEQIAVARSLLAEVDRLRAAMGEARKHLETWERQAGPGHPLGRAVADALSALGKEPT